MKTEHKKARRSGLSIMRTGRVSLVASDMLDLALLAGLRRNFLGGGAAPNVAADLLAKHLYRGAAERGLVNGIHTVERSGPSAKLTICAGGCGFGGGFHAAEGGGGFRGIDRFHDPDNNPSLGFVEN